MLTNEQRKKQRDIRVETGLTKGQAQRRAMILQDTILQVAYELRHGHAVTDEYVELARECLSQLAAVNEVIAAYAAVDPDWKRPVYRPSARLAEELEDMGVSV